MSLEIKKTALYKASFWINPKTALAKKRSIIGLLLLCLAFGFEFGYIVLATDWGSLWADRALAGAILTLAWALFFWQKNNFVEAYKKPKLYYSLSDLIASPTDFNTADFLDYESILVFKKALSFKQQGSNLALLFAFVLAKPKILQFIFNRTQLSLNEVTQFLKQALTQDSPPQNWQALVLQAGQRALALKKTRIDCGDLLVVLSQALEPWQRYLNDNGLLPADIEHLVEWHERIQNNLETRRQFYSLNNLRKRGNLARDWSASYTISLDRFIDVDYVAQIQRNNFRPIIGHQKEILALERALSKNSQNNALLVGEAGCGKKSLIEAIAQKSFTNQSTVQINDKRIIQFDIASLVSVIEGKEKTESLLDLCLAEATRAGNVILIIDNFHQYVGAKSQAGLINITAILSRYLPLKSFRLIGLTTYEGLHQNLGKNPALLSQFEKIEMTEISEEETMITLEDYYVPLFEFRNNLFVSYGGIRALALLSAKYLPNLCLPDKAIRLLEEVGAFVKNHSNDILIEEKHIRKVLSDKTQIPLENLQNQEKEKLLNLEQLLRARVVGQEEGISELASALRRSAVQVNTKRGPIGSFLFLGSTGVGKTETAKALADIYFGSEQKMIRLDMSEFQNPQDTEKILGDFENPGPFITLVRENPFSLVLIDEIEKAHPNILNLFLQILDEGWITDGVGKKVDFQNTIIIATSNAGSEIIRQDVNLDKNLNLLKSELLNIIMQQGLFKPELINRFDGVVVFRPLTLENLMEIAQMQLKKVAEQLKDKGIILEITRELKEKIAQISYSPTFGAREMRRILQDKVENSLAKVLLAGIIKRGDTIQISPIDFNVIKI